MNKTVGEESKYNKLNSLDDDCLSIVENTPKTEEKQPIKKKSLLGCMKGTFVLPLPDDFNEPLEEFAEYM
jgi:hypothetical protein